MLERFGEFQDVLLEPFKQGVVIENIFGQEGFPGAGLFCRFIEQEVVFDDNADIEGAYHIADSSSDGGITDGRIPGPIEETLCS